MDNKINVCLLNDSFPPVIDGVANAVVNYADIIQRKYGDAVVVTPGYPGAVDNYPYPVVRYPSLDTTKLVGYRTGIPYWPGALREVGQYNIDILHTHCPLVSTLIARALRSQLDVPIVLTYHTKFDIDIKNAIELGFIQSAAIKFIVSNIEACDEVWVVSEGAGQNLRTLGYTGDFLVMENGVDFPKGKTPQEAIDRVAAECGLRPDVPTFLYVGRMMWYKGIRIILDGLARAKALGTPFRMVFVGDGGDFDAIRRHAASVGLGDDCVFTGLVRDRQKLRAYFSSADLFLFPSTFDTNGIVVREAAACSLASVLVRGSSAAEGIEDGRHGILIEENASALAAAVMKAARDLKAVRAMGRTAADEIYLSWEDAVGRAGERYPSVMEAYCNTRREFPEIQDHRLFRLASDIERSMVRLKIHTNNARLRSGHSRR